MFSSKALFLFLLIDLLRALFNWLDKNFTIRKMPPSATAICKIFSVTISNAMIWVIGFITNLMLPKERFSCD